MIAQEHEQLGHIADALDHARRCASDASRDGSLHNRARITRNCRELAAALATQVARVTVRVPPADDGASVRIGTQSIPPAGWGVPSPVDPGVVTVRASHSDGRSFEQTIRVASGGSVTIDIALAMRAPTAVAVAPATTTESPSPLPSPHVEAPRRTTSSSVGAGPWVVVGAGAASLIVAGVLWSMRGSAIADRDAACDARGCDPSSINSNETARGLTLGTNLAMGLGAAAIAGGLTWFFVARSGRGEARALRPTVWIHPGGAGLSLGGAL
jgi:serine/threonine-protein kinase